MKNLNKLLKSKSGIMLDLGCGENKNPGFIGMDIYKYKGVDIVHDLEIFPWPLPNECVNKAVASHLLEHINPHKGVFIQFMDELWRVMKPHAQFAFVVPHAASHGYQQDPTHCNMINETTMDYFDPLQPSGLYSFYRPKPWKVEFQSFSKNGNLECIISKRKWDKTYLNIQSPTDITREKIDVKAIKLHE